MFRILFFIIVIAGLSFGLSLIADMDGKLIIQWPGGEIQPTLMQAVLALSVLVLTAMMLWTLFRMIMSSPEALSRYFSIKRKKKGIDALSHGLIALGSGDETMAYRHAMQARKTLPNDPMTLMLRAQAAEMQGDVLQASRLYESMLAASDTEIVGLRGLYKLALEQNELEPAEQYAARAVQRRPDLSWAVLSLFDLQCKRREWRAALATLDIASGRGHIVSKKARRLRAVILTALSIELEDEYMDEALSFAVEANRLAPTLIPAAVVAGRIYASQGKMSQAIKVIRKCWKIAPHPDLAVVIAFARPGDSVRDRLERIKSLAALTPGHKEAAIAVATAAIEAKDWASARQALAPLVRGRPSQRVCTLMARIEAADQADMGQVREWLSRAIHAIKDPAWVADGVVSDEWAPISPVSGKLDVFEWKLPPDEEMLSDETVTLKKLLAGLVTSDGLHKEHLGSESVVVETVAEGGATEAKGKSVKQDEIVTDMDAVGSPKVLADASVSDADELIVDDAIIEEIDDEDLDDLAEDDEAELDHDVKPAEKTSKDIVARKTENVNRETMSSAAVPVQKDSGESDATEKQLDTSTDRERAGQQSVSFKGKNKNKRRKRTKIFVSPPAPDDPGTDDTDDIDIIDQVPRIRY